MKHQTIDKICLKASFWPSFLAILSCLLIIVIGVVIETEKNYNKKYQSLESVGETISKSIRGEILLGDNRGLEAILKYFRNK